MAYAGDRPQAFRNVNGQFQDMTPRPGASTTPRARTWAVIAVDLDGDGQVEVMLTNDQAPGDLFVRKGDHFEDQGLASGTAFNRLGSLRAGMGITVADLIATASLDMAITGMAYQGASLFHNIGKLQYRDVAGDRGIKTATYPWFSFGSSSSTWTTTAGRT